MDNITLYIIGQIVTFAACTAINKTDISWIKQQISEIKQDLRGAEKCCQK